MKKSKIANHNIPLPSPPLSMDVEYKAKSSYPVIPSASAEGTVGSCILPPVYSTEQNQTWKILFEKHQNLIKSNSYLCKEYLEGLDLLKFNTNEVSKLAEVSNNLKKISGWQIIRVEGLVPPQKFFAMLANKVFPCTDFIRHYDEIDYTPAPDTFHDQVGHLPMLTHNRFSEFFYLFGIAGCSTKSEADVELFNRIYWFTTEFGLIKSCNQGSSNAGEQKSQIYGAGIASSCGEIVFSFSDKVKKIPFNLDLICNTNFNIHHMQDTLFEISSFDELESEFKNWAKQKKFL
jgi:phenylalanine-4-hydroxylase